jgi:glycosyltransferase involved in cell wall biosynthesis
VALKHKGSTHPEEETRHARAELLRFCTAVDIIDISSATDGGGLMATAAKSVLTGLPFNVMVYRSSAVHDRVAALCAREPFDVVHFDTIGLAQYLPLAGERPAVMTHHGAESHMIRRRIPFERNPLRRGFLWFEWLTLQRYERRLCPRFGVNVVMSDDDGEIMRRIAPDAVFVSVPNGVDVDYFKPGASAPRTSLVFAGRLDQYSNRDGMLHFMRAAWPLVAQARPEITIDIIGANPPGELRSLAAQDPRVRVHGFVPDIRPFFAAAAAAICPVRNGGGTRLKVLDALALGVPLISTTVGLEGIAARPERDVLIADSPAAFASQVNRVFEEPGLAQRVAAAGRRLVEDQYSWPALGERLTAVYKRAMSRHSGVYAPAVAQPRPAAARPVQNDENAKKPAASVLK